MGTGEHSLSLTCSRAGWVSFQGKTVLERRSVKSQLARTGRAYGGRLRTADMGNRSGPVKTSICYTRIAQLQRETWLNVVSNPNHSVKALEIVVLQGVWDPMGVKLRSHTMTR
jgi:hypothetical protein